MVRNPVMFVVLVGSIFTTLVLVRDIAAGRPDIGFTFQIALWLWFTVLFANFAEAMAEGRGKAQAETRCGARAARPRPSACAIPPAASSSRRCRPRSSARATSWSARRAT